MNDTQHNLDNRLKPYVKSALSVGLPAMGEFLLIYTYQLVDTFWVSQLGKGVPSGVVIASALMFFLMSVNEIVGVSTIPLFSQSYGSGDKRKTGYVIMQALFFKLMLGIVFCLLYYILVNNILFLYTDDATILDPARDYGNIMFLWLLFTMPYASLMTALRSIGHSFRALMVSLTGMVFNIILDPLLIFGIGPFPQLGVKGAALASVMTQVVVVIVGIIALKNNRDGIPVFRFDRWRFDPKLYMKMFTIGLPVGIVVFTAHFEVNFIASVATTFGVEASDGYGIASRVTQTLLMATYGLSIGAAITAGKFIGSGRIAEIRRNMAKLVVTVIMVLSIIALPLFIFSYHIMGLFTEVERTIQVGGTFFRFAVYNYLVMAITFILQSVFEGAGRNIPPSLVESSGILIIEIGTISILVYGIGITNINLVWLMISISVTIRLIMMYLLFRSKLWEKKVS
jgi:putative MATE family efflux protein